MKVIAVFLLLCLCLCCSPSARFNKDKAAFEASRISRSFISVADMNDSYFDIRENKFFEFYKLLFDSVKNTSYPGRYTLRGDTMLLQFYDKKGRLLLGNKALVNEAKNQVIFFR